jgi:heme/copper-type cytochrome/quinol oxidase subunit 4
MNNKEEEIKYINYQLIGLALTLITTIIAISITYNQKLNLQKRKKIFNSKKALSITKFNRITILLIGIFFLYINYKLYLISKKEGEDLKSYKLQIYASILVVISSLIALYVVTLSNTETLADVENPNI